jgi:hypothetical protein
MAGTRIRSRSHLAPLIALLTALLIAPSFAGSAPLDIKWYSFSDQNTCMNRADPVTTIFYGSATAARTSNHIGFHTGWGDTEVDGPDQYYFTGGSCNALHGQRANATAIQTRFHIRFRQSNAVDSDYGTVTIGTPHFEDIENCVFGIFPKHAVRETDENGWSGYDEGRRAIYNKMRFGHTTSTRYNGNSAVMTQCDDGMAKSNGYGRYVEIQAVEH